MRSPSQRLLRRCLLAAAAMLGVLLVTTSASTASHPFVAGERSAHELSLPTEAAARAISRAASVSRALGLPAGSASVQRLDDRFDHLTYDEVTTTDERGRPVSIVRLLPDGRVSLALGLALHASASTIDPSEATRRAASAARAVGADTTGQPVTRRSSGAGGWLVSWPRSVDGVPVRGDGTRVLLWADGAFQSISRTEHPLAARPSTRQSQPAAVRAARAFVDTRFGPTARSLVIGRSSLAWLPPNDTWDASQPDAPEQTARLAWVVELRAIGPLTQRLTAVEIWLDAGTLAVIGGDVAE